MMVQPYSLFSVTSAMTMLFPVLLLLLCLRSCYGIFNPSNETDLSRCKVYYSRSGTAYKDFFELQKPKRNESNLRLDFHFSVLAASDAHILIASTKNPQKTDPAYEIVIGAGGNTFCDIRRMQKNQVKESVRIKGLLSALDPRSFWIHMTKDGLIEVGKEGEDLAFINWKDHDPLPLSTIGFSTWPGIEAKWFFDCITDDIKKIKRNLTDEERLRKNLLKNYDPLVRPKKNESISTLVNIAPQIQALSLDESRSILNTRGIAAVLWKDEKLVWNKSDYGGITEIRVSSSEIWKPTLLAYNHIEESDIITDQSLLIVQNMGIVYWKPTLNIKTWCGPSASQHNDWPADKRNCDIIFTFWNLENLSLAYSNITNSVMNYKNIQSPEWTIEEVDVYTGSYTKTTNKKNCLYISVKLKRNSQIYSRIFLAAYFIACTAILCSFCVSPFGPYKISLVCFQLIVTLSCLIYLSVVLPAHTEAVPYIVRLHSYSFIGGVISTLISISVINLSRIEKQTPVSNILSRLLRSTVIKMVFCLPELKREEYGKLSTMTRTRDNQQYYILLGLVIDRISLLIGVGLTVYSIYLY